MMSYQELKKQEEEYRKKRLGWRECLLDLSDNELKRFVWDMHRYEAEENYHVFIKGIRVCLISLGYPEDWVNGEFYDFILKEYGHLTED